MDGRTGYEIREGSRMIAERIARAQKATEPRLQVVRKVTKATDAGKKAA